MRDRALLLVSAVPPLLLAVVGVAHPGTLTDASAERWRDMHVVLLPLFPLLALAPWLVARRESRRLGWVTAGLGYVYAVFYGALDAVAGIGAGALQLGGAEGTRLLFDQGNSLSLVGVLAYLAATLIAAGVAVRRHGPPAAPAGLIVVLAALSFLTSHIYWPTGVLTMVSLAVGWTLLALAARSPAAEAGWRAGESPPTAATD